MRVERKERKDKGQKRKHNFISTFLATDCTTSLPGRDAEKKRHHKDGTRALSQFLKRPKIVETYYDAMPSVDISNHIRQGGTDIEGAIQTAEPLSKFLASCVGFWETNGYITASLWHPYYRGRKDENFCHRDFTEDVAVVGCFWRAYRAGDIMLDTRSNSVIY